MLAPDFPLSNVRDSRFVDTILGGEVFACLANRQSAADFFGNLARNLSGGALPLGISKLLKRGRSIYSEQVPPNATIGHVIEKREFDAEALCHIGTALAGQIGLPDRGHSGGGVFGFSASLAARAVLNVPPGWVFITKESWRLAGAAFAHGVINILLVRSDPKVIRVDAGRVVTRVANEFPCRNGPLEDSVGNAMSPMGFTGDLDRAVAHSVIVDGPGPNPASVLVNADASHKTLFIHNSGSLIDFSSWSNSNYKTIEKEHTYV